MSKATVSIEGFVANEPELRQAAGKDVVNIDVAHTPRKLNKQSNEWEDSGPTTWFQATFWEDMAPAIVAAVSKGTLVRIDGFPELNVYTKQNGENAASVRIKGATLSVVPRAGNSSPRGAQGQPQQGEGWSTGNPGVDTWNGGATNDSEPTPF